jgi:glucose/arabinose dehydrogenase
LGLALAVVTGAAVLSAQEGRAPGDPIVRTALHDFRVETFLPGLVHPHSMAFTPEGDLLVTERPGRLRIVRNGQLLPTAVAGLPDVLYIGNGATPQDGREQAGLRDVVLHPSFATNRLLYLSYVKPGPNGYGNLAVARGRFENDRLSNVQDIFVANAPGNGSNRSSMWGGRIAFDRQGYLFVTLGDRQWPAVADLNRHPAQDLLTHNGKTVRLHDDGRVPTDNPFVGKPHALPEIWALGHRNAQGMAFHPVTGDLWQNEHGPQGGDELNLIEPGANYGWPVIGYGVNYTTGLAIHEGTLKDGMTPPAYVWVPSIGVSGMIFYTGNRFSGWTGDMLVGGMSGQRLMRLRLNGRKVVADEVLLQGMGRMRDVQQGPDGSIYVAIDANVRGVDGEPTPIYRLVPVERGTTR